MSMAMSEGIEQAKLLSNWLWDGMDGLKVENAGLRERLSMSALVVALHHHKALIFLLENGSLQSFMALLRPQMDAWVNGAFLHHCASDQELEGFASGESHVPPWKMFQRLEEAFEGGIFASIKAGRWKEMCDFTHTGIVQLQRNLTADTVEMNYAQDDLLRALDQANACALIAATFAAGIAGDKAFADKLVEHALHITGADPDAPDGAAS